jgi:hypothetical protein
MKKSFLSSDESCNTRNSSHLLKTTSVIQSHQSIRLNLGQQRASIVEKYTGNIFGRSQCERLTIDFSALSGAVSHYDDHKKGLSAKLDGMSLWLIHIISKVPRTSEYAPVQPPRSTFFRVTNEPCAIN